jgi:excinuclease ABC subunit C
MSWKSTCNPTCSNMFDIQEELKRVPEVPGVYIMKNKNKEVIYVGKAINLRNRLRQYFQSLSGQSPKVRVMVPKICEFEYIVTESELEALILECNLIKKYKPKFNILLKDDKSYPYIKVTMNEDYPRILMTRRIEKDKAKYFGPYSNVTAVRETLDLIKKIFPVKTCRKVLPRDIGKDRPCLNYHIYQCLGPCQGNVDKDEYRNVMNDICAFLGGKQEKIIKRLEQKMREAAENMEFEVAAGFRDKINSVRHIAEKQRVLSTSLGDKDVVAFAKAETYACVQVFFIRGGKLIGGKHFIFEDISELEARELMTSFIKQFYSSVEYIPNEIIIQEEIDEADLIEKWLGEKRAGRVHIKVPQRGEKLRLIEMAARNALITLQQSRERAKKREKLFSEGLELLADRLGLEEIPSRIEAYDISNTGSTEITASMVVFINGMPESKEYRRFRINAADGQDDYASMQEVIFRRFKHFEKERKDRQPGQHNKSEKFTRLPELIIVDGGLGHVNAVYKVLTELGIDIPVYGAVKDDKHRSRGLVGKSGELDLSEDMRILRLITAIQDEAHRFAVEYNKKLRKKRYTKSVLDEINGIGAKRKKALIKHFGSISKIKEAGMDDLMAVEGISRGIAQNIYEYFNG